MLLEQRWMFYQNNGRIEYIYIYIYIYCVCARARNVFQKNQD